MRSYCPSQAWDDYCNQQEGPCEVCRRAEDDCLCPECRQCGAVGDPDCYDQGHLARANGSIAGFIDHIGVGGPLSYTLRAIDKHNVEHVYLVLWDGTRLYYHTKDLDAIPLHTIIRRIGVGGIAWDGTDWEYSEEVEVYGDWAALDVARRNFIDALEEHTALEDAEREDDDDA